MLKQDLEPLFLAMQEAQAKATGRLAYALAKNVRTVRTELQDIYAGFKPVAGMDAYEQERKALAVELSAKNEDGTPKLITRGTHQEYDIVDKAEFMKRFEALREKHKEALAADTEQQSKVNVLLQEPSEIELYKLDHEKFIAEQETLPAENRLSGVLVDRLWELFS